MAAPLLHLIAGARPNFMKLAPLVRALKDDGRLAWRLVHTGQHHDHAMSGVFFEELGLPPPDVSLGCAGGSHAQLTARILDAYEPVVVADRPAACVVVGDVDSTLACALVARKLGVRVAHVEAGLRSGDMRMPEEINRRATDAISDWLFTTEPSAAEHLRREGHPASQIHPVGHVMVDNLLYQHTLLAGVDRQGWPGRAEQMAAVAAAGRYGVVTLHRPSNVDDAVQLVALLEALGDLSRRLPLLFPVHPRTLGRIQALRLSLPPTLVLLPPLPYRPFLALWSEAALVLTDSGGLQEETTALGVPCLTIRENTERPVTVELGSNRLVGTRAGDVVAAAHECLDALDRGEPRRRGERPPLWDGAAARRIVEVLAREV
ncbi:non-hydrolyzing UDP-N-acetylglucosamine 2-epimerase [Roseateles terrae]|uniref:UDP-N-acetylglucosamine 2-epimerase (Non-hydrolyzing) n=1 Tax=Roseateles terrae TaxID=431060 RepID=A0ABR6GQS3_9BURK|nr:UDP-N-acetylglucosamine 2-epimerase (non-hydrolyzing) [Roseateles terrae]MBB3194466.1 UDP-N-acetylglucosamine 2-epimerase (non-hydrolyzing) [Roseateles terrae]OWQ88289.1 UDP-N-acetylglucosamine 2-epimerase (non-hydrolyzing) [Roseateles terrae]